MPSFLSDSQNSFLTTPKDLVDYFEKGKKAPSSLRVGLEHEKFIFQESTLKRLPYGSKNGLFSLLNDLMPFGWEGIFENSTLIGLKKEGSSITLEPGGQLEFSSSPHLNIFDLKKQHQCYFSDLLPLIHQKDLLLLGLGFDPLSTFEEIPWVPKERYDFMGTYMPKKGTLGLDMMTRTASFQVNLDYTSEDDMCQKFQIGLALQPLISSLFASSILKERQILSFQSYRSYVWQHTDPDRTGGLEFLFEPNMGFERYITYLLDLPLYFVYRENKYIPAFSQTFRDFLKGKLKILPGQFPTLKDWELHISTVFPDVRLKPYLELRGADSGPSDVGYALSAFWVGLFYTPQSLLQIKEIVDTLSLEDRTFLRQETPKSGIHTLFRGKPLRYLLISCLEIAQAGLKHRHISHQTEQDESCFLDPLFKILDRNESLSDTISKSWRSLPSVGTQNDFIRSLGYTSSS